MTTLHRRRLLQAAGITMAGLVVPRVPLLGDHGAAVGIAADPQSVGYWVAATDGSVAAHGSARLVGGSGERPAGAAAIAAYPGGYGFWTVDAGGTVTAFGAASLFGATDAHVAERVVGMAAHPNGMGYWLLTVSGRVHAFGSARHHGDGPAGAGPYTAITANRAAGGYWLLARNGKVFAFGASDDLGQPGSGPAVGIASHPSGRGYWVVRANGKVDADGASDDFGDGDIGRSVVGIAARADAAGYWLAARDGRVVAFDKTTRQERETQPPPAPDTGEVKVTSVGGITVASKIARDVRRLLAHAEDDGVRLGGWGYRSHERQIELRKQNCGKSKYAIYEMPSSQCSPPTARPGTSMHEVGLAIDFYRRGPGGRAEAIAGTRAFRWLKRNAARYGLYNLPSEAWHWSTNGR